jgi:SNF2 family DNA or RNA helicase
MVQSRVECEELWGRLLELVEGTWRTVIFAKHRLTLDKACAVLRDAGIEHVRIDGDTNPSTRQFLIDEASSMHHPIVCSVGAAGTGLNATRYHEMIFLECSWSGGERLQCEARVHRMGQTNECTITYLFVKNSVDEKLWRSLSSKNRHIANLHHADQARTTPPSGWTPRGSLPCGSRTNKYKSHLSGSP